MDYQTYFLILAILGSFLTLEVESLPEHNPSEDEITEVELLDKAPASKNGEKFDYTPRNSSIVLDLLYRYIQLCQMNIIPLLSKPYVNEVNLNEQK